MPLLSRPAPAAYLALVYITVGALLDVWMAVWYTYLRNTEPPWLALDCASLSWSLLIRNCSYELVTVAILSSRPQRWPVRFESTCTSECLVTPICSIVCSNPLLPSPLLPPVIRLPSSTSWAR